MLKRDTETEKLNLAEPLDSVEEYTFEPIKGYPMLNWKGKRPFRSTSYFPAQLKENHGQPVDDWMNEIYWGDNLQVMSHLLKKYRGKVQLIYIDPPFDSKAEYKKKISLKGKSVENDHSAFEEKQYTDIWSNDEYLQFMYERLILMKELLADTGSIYLHCDWHKSHYLRLLLDEVYGVDNFVNEIVWKRSDAHSDSNNFGIVHDNIYLYQKSNNRIWHTLYTPYTEDYIEKQFKYIDDHTGRRYRSADLSASGLSGGGYIYDWNGIKRSWRCPKETMLRYEKEGKLDYTGKGLVRYKYFLDEMPGLKVQSVWSDLNKIHHLADERLDYPTQKPEALLERIIKASSNPGDLVFDCFMGSGTTQAVAMKLGRKFIGADINLGAIQTTTKRLLNIARELTEEQKKEALADKQGTLLPGDDDETSPAEETIHTYYTGFSVYNVNNYDVFRNPVQAKELLAQALELQPLPGNSLYDGEKDGRMVKIMPVNRIATRADLNQLISGFDYKSFEKRAGQNPGKPVESLTLVCMGHEPDLKAHLQREVKFDLDIEIVDILRDKSQLTFKRDSQARITIKKNNLVIESFYPMNLLQKLSLQKEKVDDWRELTESVMIDFNYDGAVFEPGVVDVPGKNDLVAGTYPVPDDAGTIMVKITDLLSESVEVQVEQ